ncbi:MAG: endonuclease/exonuclease/phosphatase family protein [Leptolyngbyaceae cyanobacterium bins.349]|nr:endonuclease/exonuclease/phosphatase family protein [Leptolyngbyaceae cyanobacterium bins.349]
MLPNSVSLVRAAFWRLLNFSPDMHQRRFKVATFNVYNLVLPNVIYYGDRQYSAQTFARKQLWIAGQLAAMDADVVGFQEIFHVEALQQALNTSKLYANAKLVAPPPTGTGPMVAMVSRFPVLRHRVYEVFPPEAQLTLDGAAIPIHRFSRAVLAVDVALAPELECTIFVVHLKSKRPIFPENVDRNNPLEKAKGQARALIQRAGEAIALRVILMEFLKNRNYPVILMGDINDGGQAVTSQMLSGEAPFRKTSFEQKQLTWDVLLYHVKDIQARRSYGDYYYTHIHNGHYDSLDHIMVSQEFVAENPHHIGRVGYVAVLNDHLIDDSLSTDGVKLWQSDHGQVVASIELSNESKQ